MRASQAGPQWARPFVGTNSPQGLFVSDSELVQYSGAPERVSDMVSI
jgi:hypothetical protein